MISRHGTFNRTIERLARGEASTFLRAVAFAAVGLSWMGCETPISLGGLVDAQMRCAPVNDTCEIGQCSLREDASEDVCTAPGIIAVGESCTALDSCEAHAQCARINMGRAIFATSEATPGRCLKVCARDTPQCDTGQSCTPIAINADMTRIDFGVCF